MIVADSDVLIDALRGHKPAVEKIGRELKAQSLATTSISAFELRSGARTEEEQAKVRTLLAAMTILPFDTAAADEAAKIRKTLQGSDHAIGMADYLIAGICMARSASLLTRNLRHFEKVTGLRIAGTTADESG